MPSRSPGLLSPSHFPPAEVFILAHLRDTRSHTVLFWVLEKICHWRACAWARKVWGAIAPGAFLQSPWCSQLQMERPGLHWKKMSWRWSFYFSEKLNPYSNLISPGPGQGASISRISVVSRTISAWVPSHGIWKTMFDRALRMNPTLSLHLWVTAA